MQGGDGERRPEISDCHPREGRRERSEIVRDHVPQRRRDAGKSTGDTAGQVDRDPEGENDRQEADAEHDRRQRPGELLEIGRGTLGCRARVADEVGDPLIQIVARLDVGLDGEERGLRRPRLLAVIGVQDGRRVARDHPHQIDAATVHGANFLIDDAYFGGRSGHGGSVGGEVLQVVECDEHRFMLNRDVTRLDDQDIAADAVTGEHHPVLDVAHRRVKPRGRKDLLFGGVQLGEARTDGADDDRQSDDRDRNAHRDLITQTTSHASHPQNSRLKWDFRFDAGLCRRLKSVKL